MSFIKQTILSSDLEVPTTSPTLNLDFANSQRLDPRITFTRGSTGTYIGPDGLIKTAAVNEPRFDYDPITGECKGLLIEESRTNYAGTGYSGNSTSTNFTYNSTIVTTTPNAAISPDGTNNATKIASRVTATPQFHIYFDDWTSGPAGNYCASVFVKAGETRFATLKFGSSNAIRLDTRTGTVIIEGSPSYYGAIKYANGWWRMYLVTSFSASTFYPSAFQLFAQDVNGNNFFAGDGVTGYYAYGKQIEPGVFPTSYTPTTVSGSSVTRSADNASMTGTNFSSWYNQTEGTVYCNFITNATSASLVSGPRTFQLIGNIQQANPINIDERLDHRIVSNINGSEYYTGGINFGRIVDSGVSNPSQGKITVSQNSKSRQFCMNGRTVVSATIPNAPAVDTLIIGSYNFQFTYLNGTIKKLAYYPKALPPAQLQYLTQ